MQTFKNYNYIGTQSYYTILHNNGLLGSPSDLVLIGEEVEEYESQDEEYATVEVSWDTVMLGGYTSDVTYHFSYLTVEDNELIFQLSKELPTNTTSTSVAVRDWYAGLEHLFTVKSVLKTESIVYEGPSLNASIVFGECNSYQNYIIHTGVCDIRSVFQKSLQLFLQTKPTFNCSLEQLTTASLGQ